MTVISNTESDHESSLPWPDTWSPQYLALLVYAFGMVTGRLPVGTLAVAIGLVSLSLSSPGFRGGRPLQWMALLVAWTAIGFLFTEFREIIAGEALVERVKLLLIAVLAVGAIRSVKQAQFFLFFSMICFLAYPVRGALMNFFVYSYTDFGRAVAGGIYNNSNDLAAMSLLQLSVAGSMLATSIGATRKLLLLVVAAVIALTILLTQSRGVYVGGIVFVGLIVISGKRKFRSLVAILAMFAVLAAAAPESTFERFFKFAATVSSDAGIDEADPEGSAEGRSDIYRIALQVSLDHPIFGVGVGVYPIVNEYYAYAMDDISSTAMRRNDAHSTYLTLLAENGFVGLLLFLLLVRSALLAANSARVYCLESNPPVAEQLRYLLAGYIGFMTAATVGTYTTISMTYVHLFAVWILAVTAIHTYVQNPSND